MATNGICAIKEEYIIKDRVHIDPKIQKDADLPNSFTKLEEEPPAKKIKNDSALEETSNNTEKVALEETSSNTEKVAVAKPKQKLRGQNKGRPKPMREAIELRPCPTIKNVPVGEEPKTCNYLGCKYIHNTEEFLKKKPQDINVSDGCYVFQTKGECPWGLSCRFGSEHLSADGRNLVNVEKKNSVKNQTLNTVSFDVLSKLQKKKYDLSKAENLVNQLKKDRSNKNVELIPDLIKHCEKESKISSNTENSADSTNVSIPTESSEIEKTVHSGAVTDEDVIPQKGNEKSQIDWKNKLYLGPLTTLGNLPFRRICKGLGADITCGEMALCDSLLKGIKQEWALVKRHETENLFGVQICGTNPYSVSKTAVMLEEQINVDFIDLNLGCPIDLIYKRGGGCGMLLRTNSLETSIKCVSQLLTIPFTLKTRTGVYQDTKIAHQLVPKFTEWGVSMMTIHGRSREQRYTKSADWEYINQCAIAASPCPVFGNGDVLSYEDYMKSQEVAPNVTGVMMGRGALIKPWIFTEIKEQKLWDIRSSERFDILKKFTNFGLEHWGSDNQGVEYTRRFLLEWLSFLHRYVPVGLLERPPQRINERPPYYRGRDDLETLMASPVCTDWIKISEMLLGPVPEYFNFLPKHRANSY